MASTGPEHSRTGTGPETSGDEVVGKNRPPRLNALVPVIVLVLALIVGFVVFTATRSGPNYQEEQFTPDPVQEAD